jgi:nitroreductase / dihydropteridine reductase
MEFKQLLMERYATKKFDGKDIGEEKLNAILDMTRYTPSAINLQPWKVKVISDRATLEKLSPLAMDQPQVKTCSHLLVFCANTDFEGNAAKLVSGMKKAGVPEANIKGMEAFMGNFIKNMTPAYRLSEAQAHAFMAAMTSIYAAKSVGVDSCPMQGFNAGGFANVLGLPVTLIPTLIVPLGFPADKPMPKARFSKEDLVF